MTSKIIFLTTGGTIEKIYNEKKGHLVNRTPKYEFLKELRLPYTSLEIIHLMYKDSLDLTDEDREIILNKIKSLHNQKSPIVITHGTDTMAKTVHFCNNNFDPNVPVIFTGAMKPIGFKDSDGMQNITEALMVCKIIPPGFYISFHNRLFNANHENIRKNRELLTFETF